MINEHIPTRDLSCNCLECLSYFRENNVNTAWELAIEEDSYREVEEFLDDKSRSL